MTIVTKDHRLEDILEYVQGFMDGDERLEERVELEGHLLHCGACRRTMVRVDALLPKIAFKMLTMLGSDVPVDEPFLEETRLRIRAFEAAQRVEAR